MKKSKIITIGLLALSIASCHKEKKQSNNDWNQGPNYYVNDGTGYHQGGISPFWVFYYYHMMGNRMVYEPSYLYRSPGRYGAYHSTTLGSKSTISRSSMSRGSMSRSNVSRGGFGHSSSHVGA